MAQPDNFQETNFAGSWSAYWGNIDTFSTYYELNEYYFESNTKGGGSCIWNHATCIKLLFDKCNSLQDQIDALGEPTEVTMDTILTAMLSASVDEYSKFIGIVDGYRVALWNKPFNAEFYAALARGFM